jgi:hypothetical protein
MGTLHADQFKFLSYLAHFFLEWELFQENIVEKLKTHILNSIAIFWKYCRLWDVEKYCTAGHRCQYGACAFPAEYLTLQTHTQNK